MFESDDTDANDAGNNQHSNAMLLNNKDNLILMSFRLPLTVVRKNDDTFKLVDSHSPIYPAIYKLRN